MLTENTTTYDVPNTDTTPFEQLKLVRRVSRRQGLFAPQLLRTALRQAFVMLRPDIQWKNPVMFVVEVGTVLSIVFTIAALAGHGGQAPVTYLLALDVWLFLTVLFANFASALAEARGKAQADALRKTRQETPAYRLTDDGQVEETVSTALLAGDRVVVEAGQIIPGDGEIVEKEVLLRRVLRGGPVKEIKPARRPGIDGERNEIVRPTGGGAGQVRLQMAQIDHREGEMKQRVGMIIGKCVVHVLERYHIVQRERM